MSFSHQSKFSSASKNVRKIALTKTQVPDSCPTNLKAIGKISKEWTPRKQLKDRLSQIKSASKGRLKQPSVQPYQPKSKRSCEGPGGISPRTQFFRYKTVAVDDEIEAGIRLDGYFTNREQRSPTEDSEANAQQRRKCSIIIDRVHNKASPEYLHKSGVSQPTLLSECDSPNGKKRSDINQLDRNEQVVSSQYENDRESKPTNPPCSNTKPKPSCKMRGLFITNIDLSKASGTSDGTLEGWPGIRVVASPTGSIKPSEASDQLNNLNPIQNRTEMRKSRDSYRPSVSQSYVFNSRDLCDRANSKENILMPQTGFTCDEKGSTSSRVSKYERILNDKQKQCTRLIIDNQNLTSEVRSCQTRISSIQENYGRMEAVASTAHKTICELRDEIKRLRDEISTTRLFNQKELQLKERQFRSHVERLLSEKNDNLERLQGQLREKQSEIQHTHRRTNESSADKVNETEKLVEFYRKENKVLGLELFNNKKGMELLASAHETLKAELKLAGDQIELLNSSLKLKEHHLIERQNQLNEKVRQNQHEKNLIYESLTKTIKSKDEELYALRRQLFILSSEVEGELLMRSQSAENLAMSRRVIQLQDQKTKEQLSAQLEQYKSQIERLTGLLKKETADREKAQNEKKILLTALIDKQKKQEQQRKLEATRNDSSPLGQSLKQKTEEVQRLSEQLKSKCSEVGHLSNHLHSLQNKNGKLELLINQTNDEILRLRLERLESKFINGN